MLVLYATPTTRATRVAWALEEAGAAYDYRAVDLMSGEGRSREYRALNPAGKVPTLIDGDLVITESLAICLYLAERFPDARLAPAVGTPERGHYLRWAAFVACELEQPLWTLAKHRFALPEARRVPAIFDTARWEFQRAAQVLAARTAESEHLAGDAFSAADILAGHTLAWARKAHGPLEDAGLGAYADRVLARPALARARERERATPAA